MDEYGINEGRLLILDSGNNFPSTIKPISRTTRLGKSKFRLGRDWSSEFIRNLQHNAVVIVIAASQYWY